MMFVSKERSDAKNDQGHLSGALFLYSFTLYARTQLCQP